MVIVGLLGRIIITRLLILDPSYLIINILLKDIIIIIINNSISRRLYKYNIVSFLADISNYKLLAER